MRTVRRKIASAGALLIGVGSVCAVGENWENFATEVVASSEDSDESETGVAASRPMLDKLVELAEKDGRVYAICEVCDGVSRTRRIRPASRSQNAYSVAKLFAVTAVMILQDRGVLDVDEPIFPILKEKFPENFDPKWRDVKISDALTHRVGFESGFLDIDAENPNDWGSQDYLRLVLERPLKYKPGEKSVYSDAAFYLISRIVSEKTGERLDDFLIREVLAPAKFAECAFAKCPQGFPIGATGLYVSTEDMAKLGVIYAQRGVYEGKRVLSEAAVDETLRRGFELRPVGDSGFAFGKGGMRGQFLYVNVKTKRVVAIHSCDANLDEILGYLVENDR